MGLSDLPAVQPAEESLAWHERLKMALEERPRPLGHTHHAIARVGLRASGSHLPARDLAVRVHARECRRHLHTGAIEQREEGGVGLGGVLNDSEAVGERDLDDARLCRRWRLHVADRVGREHADLYQIRGEALRGREVLPPGCTRDRASWLPIFYLRQQNVAFG